MQSPLHFKFKPQVFWNPLNCKLPPKSKNVMKNTKNEEDEFLPQEVADKSKIWFKVNET